MQSSLCFPLTSYSAHTAEGVSVNTVVHDLVMKWNPTGNWIGRVCLSTLWAPSDEERQTRPCVCVRTRLGADALITIIPNIHRSPPTCRINIRNLPYALHGASVRFCSHVDRAMPYLWWRFSGWCLGKWKQREHLSINRSPPSFLVNPFLCPLALMLLPTGACSDSDLGRMMHFLASQTASTVETVFPQSLRDIERLLSGVWNVRIKCILYQQPKVWSTFACFIRAINYAKQMLPDTSLVRLIGCRNRLNCPGQPWLNEIWEAFCSIPQMQMEPESRRALPQRSCLWWSFVRPPFSCRG